MYHGLRQVWGGLAKNATEGLASPANLPVFTVLLTVGHILPVFLAAFALAIGDTWITVLSLSALMMSLWPRLAAAWRFRQPLLGAILHPVGITLLLAIQWYAFVRNMAGRPIPWKGRT